MGIKLGRDLETGVAMAGRSDTVVKQVGRTARLPWATRTGKYAVGRIYILTLTLEKNLERD